MDNRNFYKEMLTIGLPITLQSIFQASYSVIDQLMVGQLGTVSIAGAGLGGKFSSLFIVTIGAVATVASILISQYGGNNDENGINLTFFTNLYIGMIVSIIFAIPSFFAPQKIMHLYTTDVQTYTIAAEYLKIISVSFVPMIFTIIAASFLRSVELSKYPLYCSIISMIVNIIGNYILIFGKLGVSPMGLNGAAIATLISRTIECILLGIFLKKGTQALKMKLTFKIAIKKDFLAKIFIILLPILANEFLWSVGENIYAFIYGRIGTEALAAMTLTNPIQGMFTGVFSGVSAAAVVMIGNRLGKDSYEESYYVSKLLIKVGFIGAVLTGIILAAASGIYVKLFNIEPQVSEITKYILYVFSIMLFVKVLNMILGGGILRSGGNTKLTLVIDLIGTWVFGVPLGLFSAFVLKLPIHWVYLILSMEEGVRLIISLISFKKKVWMNNLTK